MDPFWNLQAYEPALGHSVTQAVLSAAHERGMTIEYFIDLFNLERAKDNAQYGIMLVSTPSPLCIVLTPYPGSLLILTLQPFTASSKRPRQPSPAQHGK